MARPAVVDLTAARLAPVPEVVEGLRGLLARAESGELRGYVLGGGADRGCDFSAFMVGDCTIAVLLLGLYRAKQRLLDHRGDD